jgi:DNA-binding response OmpR family regulator
MRLDMENKKILIVDDDPDIRSALTTTLEGEGFTVITASKKSEGEEKFKAEKPDLAILDVMMTVGEDGFEMAREMKKDPEVSGIPILLLTGVKEKTGIDFKDSAGDATWCPVDGFLDKPVEPDVLIAEVKRLLNR